ncbi:Ger(x)C family spore germination protein [Paenibacillus alginolyticus]|uniref:Ger(X)C family spore germination protein n=1 Tax=Paenibacillus alginolyticus TaxID=59839 RepID=A0ABT4GB76_9BACL|nr:Ger(x)C family spore germination protein [Paenibacillus alginolyticus]MCY9693442.1 Ger(x)C family spore germination protein [Paenibacillus alginolyticus]MEC0146037.1 Ger(x)C family spore germination protein [Paenibacillus alginolyticus]
MKVCIKSLILILLISLLGGCWDRTELNDLALITALAFDKSEDNQVKVSVQVVIPQNQGGAGMIGGGGGGGTAKKTTVRTEEHGFDTADALSKLQRKIPRRLFWGQCKIFIFSDSLAKSGIREQFDFLVRHPQPRERAFMFISKGKAADALELFPPIERSSAEVLRKLSELQIGISVTIEQMSIMLKGDSHTAALPLVYILPKNKSAEPFQTIPYLFGTAVFKKDKMVGEISEKVTRGVMWIKNEIKEYTVTYEANESEGLVSLKPVKANVKLIPKIEGEKWMMTLKVQTEGDIVQNSTLLNPMNPDLLSNMNKAFANDVRGRIQLALQEIQERLKVDILGFATEFHRKYPKQWEKNKDNWEELFPKVEVNLDIKTQILRPGLINSPGGMPKEEVIEK